MAKTRIQIWLTEYYAWRESASGYAQSTPAYQAATGYMDQAFKANLPWGVQPPYPWMCDLEHCIGNLFDQKKAAKYMNTMHMYYILGPQETIKRLKRSSRTIRFQKNKAEQLIQQAMNEL